MLRDPQTVYNRACERAQEVQAERGLPDRKQDSRLQQRRASISRYSLGQLVEGTVTRVQPYGAFVSLDDGGVALLHISQITHERLLKVEQIFEPGNRVTALVLKVDVDAGRMSLSTKKLEVQPGDFFRDPELVYSTAEDMAAAFRERLGPGLGSM
jgi:small subunit ribosomal protein S1